MKQNNEIEEIKAEICDGYCKFSEIYLGKYKEPDEAYDKLIEEKCADCPLGRL